MCYWQINDDDNLARIAVLPNEHHSLWAAQSINQSQNY